MPELPEVDVITGVVARHAIGRRIVNVDVVRQPKNLAYFFPNKPYDIGITNVYRRGKHVLIELEHGMWIDAHNAMTGYWDWEHEPWTFDYVEGARSATSNDVRVRVNLDDGKVLRFHDLRFFGRMSLIAARDLPTVGPELMVTPHGMPGAPVVTLPDFARWILGERRPVKLALMDQACLAGIGNIYANEGCHVAGVDPSTPGDNLDPALVPVLLEALRYVCDLRMDGIDYSELLIYRRDSCGTCGSPVIRTEIAKRATFSCPACQI